MSTSNSWISSTESGLLTQASSLKDQVAANRAALGLTTNDVAELTKGADDFEIALNAKTTAEASYRASVLASKTAQNNLKNLMSALNKDVQANSAVDDKLKAKVGFPVYKKPSRGAPSIPTGLAATLEGESTAFLRWNRNGNPSSAIFTVEMSVGNGPWVPAGSTTASRWRIELSSPGTTTSFRVKARRGELVSSASTTVTLWPDEGTSFLHAAA